MEAREIQIGALVGACLSAGVALGNAAGTIPDASVIPFIRGIVCTLLGIAIVGRVL